MCCMFFLNQRFSVSLSFSVALYWLNSTKRFMTTLFFPYTICHDWFQCLSPRQLLCDIPSPTFFLEGGGATSHLFLAKSTWNGIHMILDHVLIFVKVGGGVRNETSEGLNCFWISFRLCMATDPLNLFQCTR